MIKEQWQKLKQYNDYIVSQINGKETLTLYPFLLHSLSMSIFSSVIGPFGGFFASGFKRAFKIKVMQFYKIRLCFILSVYIIILILITNIITSLKYRTLETLFLVMVE